MAQRERWFFDQWELTDGFARDLETFEGTDVASPYAGTNVPIPRRAGEVWVPKVVGPGSFSLSMWLAGADRAEVLAVWALILRAARRPHRMVEVRRFMPDGDVRFCYCELAGQVAPTFVGDQGMRAQLTFTVPSGNWQSLTNYTMGTTAGPGLPVGLDLLDLAASTTAMETLAYTVHGPVTNPAVVDVTDGLDGDYVLYVGTIPAGGSITYHTTTYEVTGGGGFTPNIGAVNYNGTRFVSLPAARPGHVPRVELRGSGGGAGTRLEVFGRRAYAC